ncbi:MAG: FmdE family protein [Desulfobacterales bacterium]|nr:FmdE family protein [Desulfobacterales bacterium]
MAAQTTEQLVCGKKIATVLELIQQFHGWTAPGLLLGVFMVDRARKLIGPAVEADAVVETFHCLPDAVQLFTPCTLGNGWLKVLDWDKFALSLYDRRTLRGYRVWLDLKKTRTYPDLYNWYMRKVPKKDLPLPVLLETILSAGPHVLSACPVRMTDLYKRRKKGVIEICPSCNEAYPVLQGRKCTACQGMGYAEQMTIPLPDNCSPGQNS